MAKIIDELKHIARPIDDFQLDPKNARTGHALKAIRESLEKYGQRKPIVVNSRTGYIIAGNGTWRAAKDAGWTEIAAVLVEDDDETAIGFALADNRLGDLSFFDPGTLTELFDGMDDPLDIPGVSADWLESFGIGIDSDEQPADEFPEYDEDIKTDNECPKCGYKWSGGN